MMHLNHISNLTNIPESLCQIGGLPSIKVVIFGDHPLILMTLLLPKNSVMS